MNVILCASKFINKDIEHNANKVIEFLMMNSNKEIDFLFFGESFLNGFESLTWDYNQDKTMKEDTKKYLKLLSEKCKIYKCGLGIGYFEFDQGKIYSSYIVFDSNGNQLVNYRRISIGWRYHRVDSNIYCEGTSIESFEYKGKKFGIGLCGDVWTNPLYDYFIENDYDIFIWPVYVNYNKLRWVEDERSDYFNKSKPLGKHVLYINSVSNEPSYGGAYIMSHGKIVEETELGNEETYIEATIE